ncbi:accessory Sec-dependent serine-rich glycoprotein adhesin, partial [Streptococcus penaeicida]|uniref:accessory Sec-dependent serine-rich glycoprotein adhesin n=1 Tax=Streptococcus penaeicida TaxID=1765960 RepID=UPI0039EF9D91
MGIHYLSRERERNNILRKFKKFNKSSFIETESKSRVKLHKSGKSWVKTTLASFGLIQLFKGGQVEEHIIDDSVDFVVPRKQLLKGALGIGAIAGGATLGHTAFAAETTSSLPVTSETGTTALAGTDSTVVATSSTSTSGTVSDTSSMSMSQSDSLSQSTSQSQSASNSALVSSSDSQSESQSQSSSTFTSTSTSLITSSSSSTSTSNTSSLSPKTSTFATTTLSATGTVNNNLVTVTSSYIKDTSYNDGYIYPQDGESLEYYTKFTVDNAATAGDQFTMTYSPYTAPSDFDMANWTPTDITDSSGEVIATGTWDATSKTVTYTFTTYVDKYQNVIASLNASSYIDRSVVQNDANLTLTYSLGGETTSKTEYVRYQSPIVYGSSSIQSVFNELDSVNHTVEQIFYVNPMDYAAYTTYFNVYGYQINPNTGAMVQQGSTVINSTTTIQVYKAGTGSTLPDSMDVLDYSTLTKVTPSITYGTDSARINLGTISDVYVIRVVSTYDPNSTNPIVQSGTMSSYDYSGYYSIVETNNYVVFTSDTSGGTGTAVTYSAGDYVWFDTNKDGLQTTGESPAANVLVTLTYSDGTKKSVYTDAAGHYQFDGLLDKNTYTITITPPTGYVLTTSNVGTNRLIDSNGTSTTFTIAGANNMTIDGGLIQDPVSLSTSTSASLSASTSTSTSTSKSTSTSLSNSTSTSKSTSTSLSTST